MPSPGEDIQAWSVVAGNNGTADPLINWAEGQARASVNNSARSMLAAHAKNRNLINGSIVTTGTVNAQQFLSGLTYTTIPTNLVVQLKIGGGLTNTGPVTLNMDGLGDTSIKTADGVDCKGGELVGDGYVDLLYNGTNWIFLYGREFFWNAMTGGGGIIIGKQIFTASGTYTPTPDTECCIIECVGGGGGGGGGLGTGVLGGYMSGGGGGSGGYSRKIATASDIGVSQVVTIGPAGAAGGPGVAGSNGGATSIGALCIANGGLGGGGASVSNNACAGGAGGAAGTGDIAAVGAPGGKGEHRNAPGTGDAGTSGHGGSSCFGGGGVGVISASGGATGGAAGNYGSGGGGGSGANTGTGGSGGAGSAGVVIITEFAGRGAPGRDGIDGPAGPIGPIGPSGAGTGDVLRFGTPTVGQMARWVSASQIEGFDNTFPPQGRLTLQTGVPVMTTTQSAKTTIFYSPFCGNQVPIYTGTVWTTMSFNELSALTTDTTKSPAAIGASKVNDWYVWNDSGTLRLSHGPDWSSDTARAATLTRLNGIWVNTALITNGPGAQRGTYVGTTRSNVSSQLDFIFAGVAAKGVAGFIGVWNAYNRVDVAMMAGDNTDSWTYAVAAWRAADAPSQMTVGFVSGLAEDGFDATYIGSLGASGSNAGFGIGYDTTTAFSGSAGFAGTSAGTYEVTARFGATALGYHSVNAIEYANGSVLYYGDVGMTWIQTGLHFRWRC